jgi:hypothetical protein
MTLGDAKATIVLRKKIRCWVYSRKHNQYCTKGVKNTNGMTLGGGKEATMLRKRQSVWYT